jgi:Ice-binding-like
MNKLFCYAAVALLFLTPNVHFGQAPNLRSAANFALFTAAGAFNSNVATTVTGDIGTNAGAYVPPGVLIGTSHVVDAVSAQAANDVMLAYAQVFGLACGNVIGVGLGGGQILPNPAAPSPHIYCLGGASTLNGELILDGQGDPNALFIFQINGAFASAVNSKVTLRNGATACNVYWQINGAVSLATGTDFKGTILANGAIHLLGNATLQGRALSTAGEISTEANVVTLDPVPSVIATTVVGAMTTFCAGGSVTLGGNTNGGTWCNGANPTATPMATSITVNTSGDYFVKNTACGRTVMSNHIIVTVNSLPLAIVGTPVSICSGNSVQLGTAPIAGHTYVWAGAGLSANNIANPIATPLVTTTYTLTETIIATGCQMTNSVTITVTIGAAGGCIITGSNTICPATTTQLCVPVVAGASYNWSTVGGTIVGLTTTACITISAAGTYSVTVTGAGLGACVSTCMKTITVVNPVISPMIIASGVTTFCAGGNVVLSGNTNGGIWTTTSATPILTPNAISIIASTSGTYRLTNSNICSDLFTEIIITVNPLPNCTITGNYRVYTKYQRLKY